MVNDISTYRQRKYVYDSQKKFCFPEIIVWKTVIRAEIKVRLYNLMVRVSNSTLTAPTMGRPQLYHTPGKKLAANWAKSKHHYDR